MPRLLSLVVKSIDKGKVGEREVRDLLRKYGFDARRGQQFSGGGDSPDVVHNMEGFHIEVKRTERFDMWGAIAQAERDAKPGDVPLVFHRPSKKKWKVVIDAEDFLKLMQQYVFIDEEA